MANKTITLPLEEYQELAEFKQKMDTTFNLVCTEIQISHLHYYRRTVNYISKDRALIEVKEHFDIEVKELKDKISGLEKKLKNRWRFW